MKKTTIDGGRSMVLRLAIAAECDPRTAARAIEQGIDSIKGVFMRERLERAFSELGIKNKKGSK